MRVPNNLMKVITSSRNCLVQRVCQMDGNNKISIKILEVHYWNRSFHKMETVLSENLKIERGEGYLDNHFIILYLFYVQKFEQDRRLQNQYIGFHLSYLNDLTRREREGLLFRCFKKDRLFVGINIFPCTSFVFSGTLFRNWLRKSVF